MAKGIQLSQSWPYADLRDVSIILSLYVRDIGVGLDTMLRHIHEVSNIEYIRYYMLLFTTCFKAKFVHALIPLSIFPPNPTQPNPTMVACIVNFLLRQLVRWSGSGQFASQTTRSIPWPSYR
jgi:hypothetical protein